MKTPSTISMTLRDYKFDPDESRFLETNVYSLYTPYSAALALSLRDFCSQIRHHPSLRMKYEVMAHEGEVVHQVGERFFASTDRHLPFLVMRIGQAPIEGEWTPNDYTKDANGKAHLRTADIVTAFDEFVQTHRHARYPTRIEAICVDLLTIAHHLRTMLVGLTGADVTGKVGIVDDKFYLQLEHTADCLLTRAQIVFSISEMETTELINECKW